MKKLLFLLLVLLFSTTIFSQTFETEISDTANYSYGSCSSVYEINNTYNFFLKKFPRDSFQCDVANINFIQLDSTGNVITDTILFPNLKMRDCHVLRSKNNYYIITETVNKISDANGKLLKLDSAFNIVAEKNFPLIGDSTFGMPIIEEVENNNIMFEWLQYVQPSGSPESYMFKTDENLDSLNYAHFPFFTPHIANDTLNHRYVATPMDPNDTIFAYISYDLTLDSVQLAPMYLPQFLSYFQNTVFLLNNHKKIYSNTSVAPDYYMAIYLFDKNMQVLNYHIIESDAYPGEYSSLSYIPNSPYFYFVGSTNYMAYPEDSNSIILARMDTNLNIDYIHYFHHERAVRPLYIKTTQDNGCIILGDIGYIRTGGNYASGRYIIKFDSLGNLTWSHGIDVQEQVALVYPNPAKDILYVQNGLIKQKAHLILFDINGRTILNEPLQPYDNKLNIAHIKSGLYIYQISGNGKIYQSGKIIKE